MSKGGLSASMHTGADKYRRRLLAAAGLSNNMLFSNLNTTITVKSSPPKTAEDTARLGIVSGFLTKRNEQHSWQRRFCTLVPHSLLYYFEDEDADAPRGIIDLEYYTDISAQPNNVVRLATSDGDAHRTFYFQADSEEEMNAWMSALIRERYFVLRDERDAYQELQHDFQAQTDDMASVMRAAAAECKAVGEVEARALREESEVAEQLSELVKSVQSAAGQVSIGPENEPFLSASSPGVGQSSSSSSSSVQRQNSGAIRKEALEALAKAGRTLKDRVKDLERSLVESKRGAARADREHKAYQDQVQKLTEAFDREREALAYEQRCKQQSHDDVEALRRELDEARVNLGIVERTRENAESRVAELHDQKKLLVREVKQARKILAEKQAALARRRQEARDRQAQQLSSRGSNSPPPNAANPRASIFAQALNQNKNVHSQDADDVAVAVSRRASEGGASSDLESDDGALDPLRLSFSSDDVPPARQTHLDPGASPSSNSFKKPEPKHNAWTEFRSLVDAAAPKVSTSSLGGFLRSSGPATKKKAVLSTEEPDDRLVIRCRRCRGTVEGPKNSTCRCTVPLVGDAPDDQPAFFPTSFGALFGTSSSPGRKKNQVPAAPTSNQPPAQQTEEVPVADHSAAVPQPQPGCADDHPPEENVAAPSTSPDDGIDEPPNDASAAPGGGGGDGGPPPTASGDKNLVKL